MKTRSVYTNSLYDCVRLQKEIRVLGKASIYANFFTIQISEYDKSVIIRLYLNLKKYDI